MGFRVAGKVREVLEKKTGIPLTLSLRPLDLPLDQSINARLTTDERRAFIMNELLGWSFPHLLQRSRGLLGPGDSPLTGEIRAVTLDRSRHSSRRLVRDALEAGLSEKFGAPVHLDGHLRVLAAPVADLLKALPSAEARLDWLLEEVLVWSGREFLRQAGYRGYVQVRPPAMNNPLSLDRWARFRHALEQGLARRQEPIHLDEHLRPIGVFSEAQTGLEERGDGPPPVLEAPLLNLTVRGMAPHDIVTGDLEGQVMEVQESDLRPEIKWHSDRFLGYALMDQALVVCDENSKVDTRKRIAGFFAYEIKGGHWEAAEPEPERVEITHFGIDPAYAESGQVGRKMLEWLRQKHPGLAITVLVREDDDKAAVFFRKMGSTSRLVPNKLAERDNLLFTLSRGSKAPERDPDSEVLWNLDQMDRQQISLEEAAWAVARVLEKVAAGSAPFTRWREAHQILEEIDALSGLGRAVFLRVYLDRVVARGPDGEDPRPELRRQIDLFKESHQNWLPSEYLARIWEVGDGSAAGLEEGKPEPGRQEPSRRDFLRTVAASWSLTQTGLPLEEVARAAAQEDVAGTIRFFVSRIGFQEVFDAQRFKESPQEAIAAWQEELERATEELSPGAALSAEDYAWPSRKLLFGLKEAIGLNQRQLRNLGGPSILRRQGLPVTKSKFKGLDRLIHAAKGEGNLQDLLRYWDYQTLHSIATFRRTLASLKSKEKPTEAIAAWEQGLRLAERRRENFEQFTRRSLDERQRIVQKLLWSRISSLEALEKEIAPAIAEQFLESGKVRARRWQNRRMWRVRKAGDDVRRAFQAVRPRVPPGAIFVAVVPAGDSPQARGFVDDGGLIQEAIEHDPELHGVAFVPQKLLPGEDPLERARAIAQQYAVPGRQLTIGIALGLLSDQQAGVLYEIWPSILQTTDPQLFLSFIYTPSDALDQAEREGRYRMPSLSSQFRRWAQTGRNGLIIDLPEISLPPALWQEFEHSLRGQAGLEEAA